MSRRSRRMSAFRSCSSRCRVRSQRREAPDRLPTSCECSTRLHVSGGVNSMPYDPTIYQGSATYYIHGRPAYSPALVPTLAAELGLDGSGRLLDVGCGPGVLAIAL